ncbi:hypothetical protein KKG22_01230 [Patescibacteria group bacterium]|nr:hypothetical protein [Patescibacteria group bacterium]MBU1722056.1 hypothetical protein [Patescibacteria group bacterium]MBU1901527.1 hypothetical protein [Patescibacteria group bacterium]
MAKKRIHGLDFLRGVAIFFMLVTHINAVFITKGNYALDKLSWFGATCCFSAFLFCFAFIYGKQITANKWDTKKQWKRFGQIILVYYISALLAAFFLYPPLSLAETGEILILKHIPLYTEFILAFALYILLIIPFRPVLKQIRRFPIAAIILSIFVYVLSRWLYTIDVPTWFVTTKALFVGDAHMHTFGVLSYAPIFMLGFLFGALKDNAYKKNLLYTLFGLSSIAASILRLTDYSLWYRFPPSSLFLLYGVAYILGLLLLYPYLKKIRPLHQYMLFLGQNALNIFILNIIVILGSFFLFHHQTIAHTYILLLYISLIGAISLLVMFLQKYTHRKQRRFFKKKKSIIFLSLLAIGLFGFAVSFVVSFFSHPESNPFARIILPNTNVCELVERDDSNIVAVSLDKTWLLLGDEFTQEEQTLTLNITLNDSFNFTYPEQTIRAIRFELFTTNNTSTSIIEEFIPTSTPQIYDMEQIIDGAKLLPGDYIAQLTLSFDCGDITQLTDIFHISYPYYVLWSIDWEGYDMKNEFLDEMARFSDEYGIPMSHFFNPRLLMTASIPQERKDYIVGWVKKRLQENGGTDSLDLHIHMFYDLAKAMDIEVQKEIKVALTPTSSIQMTTTTLPQWGYYLPDGYDIPFSSLSKKDTGKALQYALDIFKRNNLPRPTAFRAGGWFADSETLQVLEEYSFLIDTSGRTAYTFGTNNMAGDWHLAANSQPYRPNRFDQNAKTAPQIQLWEFPNNGADSWWSSTQELLDRFEQNWPTRPEVLTQKTTIVYLSHPEWFDRDTPKLNELFPHIDQYSYLKDAGPVLYINFDDLYHIWGITNTIK